MNKEKMVEMIKTSIISIAPEFCEEDITWETRLIEDLMFDSIRVIELIVGIEEIFDIEIDGEDMTIDKIGVFQNLYEIVKDKCNE